MRANAVKLLELLQDRKHTAVLAGGCVRDSLMGFEPKDFDIATSAKPDEIIEILTREGIKIIPVGASFGVIIAHIEGINFEIATFRNDGKYSDSRRPDTVEYVLDPALDAARRDFTINSLFSNQDGFISDYYGGSEDIQNKLIRAVGNPGDRLSEDPLRMLRAIRFASRYGFSIEGNTAAAIQENAHLILNVSKERISKELELMLMGSNPSMAFNFMRDLNLIEHVLPELAELYSDKGEQDPNHHPEGNTWNHTLMVLDILSKSEHKTPGLMFAGLLHDIGKPITQERHDNGRITNHSHDDAGEPIAKNICERLKLSRLDTEFITYAVKIHMRLHNLENMRKSKSRAILSHPRVLELIELQHGDALGRGHCCSKESMKDTNLKLLKYFTNEAPLKVNETPIINGKFLIEMGLKPSPLFKHLINAGIEAQLNGEIKDPVMWLDTKLGLIKHS